MLSLGKEYTIAANSCMANSNKNKPHEETRQTDIGKGGKSMNGAQLPFLYTGTAQSFNRQGNRHEIKEFGLQEGNFNEGFKYCQTQLV